MDNPETDKLSQEQVNIDDYECEVELSQEDKKFIIDREAGLCAVTKKNYGNPKLLKIHKILKDKPATASNLILVHKELSNKANHFYRTNHLESWYGLHPNDLLDLINSDLSYGDNVIMYKIGKHLIPSDNQGRMLMRQKGPFKRYMRDMEVQNAGKAT